MMNHGMELDEQGRTVISDVHVLDQVAGGDVDVPLSKEIIEAIADGVSQIIEATGDAISTVIDSMYGNGGGGPPDEIPTPEAQD